LRPLNRTQLDQAHPYSDVTHRARSAGSRPCTLVARPSSWPRSPRVRPGRSGACEGVVQACTLSERSFFARAPLGCDVSRGRERDVRDESASVCLGGAGRQCIEAVLPLVRKPRLAPDQLTRVDTGFMSTFPQLSTSKKVHGFMRFRGSVAQNDRSGDALQEAPLNPLIFTCQHESRAPDTRIGCGRTNA